MHIIYFIEKIVMYVLLVYTSFYVIIVGSRLFYKYFFVFKNEFYDLFKRRGS